MNEYEEERDRNMAVAPESEFVLTAMPAMPKGSHVKEGQCEQIGCAKRSMFWVQRGPINLCVCSSHLASTVRRFHQIRPGRYARTADYEGYWISAHHTIVVKMRVGDKGLWR